MGLLYGRAGRLTAQNGGFRRGQYTNWTGVWHGAGSEYGESGTWLDAMGPGTFEVKLEAGTRPVELASGDYIHFFAAVACNDYVKRGNYTVGAWAAARHLTVTLLRLFSGLVGGRLDGAGQR